MIQRARDEIIAAVIHASVVDARLARPVDDPNGIVWTYQQDTPA